MSDGSKHLDSTMTSSCDDSHVEDERGVSELLDRSVSSISRVSILSCYTIRARALSVEEPQLGRISSGSS